MPLQNIRCIDQVPLQNFIKLSDNVEFAIRSLCPDDHNEKKENRMNKTVFRMLSLVLYLVMIFSLAACGKTEQPAPAGESSPETPAGTAAAAEAAPTAADGNYGWKSSFTTIRMNQF